MFVGAGTITNVVAVLVGSGLGMLIGHRLPARAAPPSPRRSAW